MKTGKEDTLIVEALKKIIIQPNVYHKITAIEDFTIIEPYDDKSMDVVKV